MFSANFSRRFQIIMLVSCIIIVSFLPACSRSPVAEFEASITEGQAPLLVNFTNNSKNADEFQWDFGDGSPIGTAKPESVTHEYTIAGTYSVVLTAIKKKGEVTETNTATLTILVEHGQLSRVSISPDKAEITCAESQKFTAVAVDAYDNLIPEAQLTWSTSEGVAAIDSSGMLSMGTKAGTYNNAIRVVAKVNGNSAEATTSITVHHGPLYRVILMPQVPMLELGEKLWFLAMPLDELGHEITDCVFTWEVANGLGTITDNGLFTPGTQTGYINNAVSVTASLDTASVRISVPITINPMDSPAVLQGLQILRVNLGGEPSTIDPNKASWSLERSVIMQVFDGLLGYNQDLTLRAVTAIDIPTVSNNGISADGLTYIFKLRPDVTWSDGKKVTSNDYVYSIKRMLSPDIRCEYASFYFSIVGAETYFSATDKTDAQKTALRDAVGVKATDDYTLEIKLIRPLPTFLQLMALWPVYPVRADTITQFGDKWTEPPNYIGNGPFVLKEWVHQDHMTFIRNDNYWGTKPHLTEITYKMMWIPMSRLRLTRIANSTSPASRLAPRKLPWRTRC